ncbi:MAG: hypothetical protein AAF203_07045 [Pseudomonadota bacterium]
MRLFKTLLSVVLLAALPASAEMFNPTVLVDETGALPPGLTLSGLQQTMASQILTGEKGDDFTVKVDGRPFFLKMKVQEEVPGDNNDRHLVIVVPGFGANKDEGAASYLSDVIIRETNGASKFLESDNLGFITLSSHSPAAPDFIKHSHSSGFPGDQVTDAKDLYKMIQASIEKLESPVASRAPLGKNRGARVRRRKNKGQRKKQFNIVKVSLVGASLGSMNVSHLMAIDLEKQKRGDADTIGFHKVVAINPPVSNVYGSTAIDHMVNLSRDAGLLKKVESIVGAVDAFVFKKVDAKIFKDLKSTRKYIRNYNREIARKPFGVDELFFLVGYGFAPTVEDAVAAAQERDGEDGEPLVDKDANIEILFTEYLKLYTYPAFRKNYVEMNGEDPNPKYSAMAEEFGYGNSRTGLALIEESSIGVLIPNLQAQNYDLSHYHLVTWADDFLLRQSDPKWIADNLPGGTKGNSQVYFRPGGHLGGYAQQGFLDYFLGTLTE